MINLYPRDYKNLKWDIKPQNIVNTLVIPLRDGSLSEGQVIASQTLTTCDKGNLPLNNTSKPTHQRYMYNRHRLFTDTAGFAKARVECIMASGECTFDIPTAIIGNISAKITLVGRTYIVGRGERSYSTYPDADDLSDQNYSLASWIVNKSTDTYDYLTWDYSNNVFTLNPWVRKIKMPTNDKVTGIVPSPESIATLWCDYTKSGYQAEKGSWVQETTGNYISSGVVDVSPPNTLEQFNPIDPDQILPLENLSQKITCNVIKNGEGNYTVTWNAPVRYAYCAASRRIMPIIGTVYEIDNYAFLDEVTEIQIDLLATIINTDTSDEIATIDNQGDISFGEASGEHVLTLPENELLTRRTSYLDVFWSSYLFSNILKHNYMGRYVVSLDVTAQYALTNNIGIGSQICVYQQDGTPIVRKRSLCIFEVMNITKRFESSKFIYTLHLKERVRNG